MTDDTFETFVARERARLHGERDAIFTQQQDLQQKLEAVNRELDAIEAYEGAKSGKAPARRPNRAHQRQPGSARRPKISRRVRHHEAPYPIASR
jgi:hypothetical protein